jgi:hypothetical protein
VRLHVVPQMRAVAGGLGVMKPASMRMVVDLPAPLGPRKPTTSPRAYLEADDVHGREAAEALGQALALDQCRHMQAPPGRGCSRGGGIV